MAFRHLGESPKKALPGQMLLVVRKLPPMQGVGRLSCSFSRFPNEQMLHGLSRENDLGCAYADGKMIDDFEARSPDELSLQKGERIELIERDDDFGDGWYLGKHVQNGRVGLFPEGTSHRREGHVRNGLCFDKWF